MEKSYIILRNGGITPRPLANAHTRGGYPLPAENAISRAKKDLRR